jgi:UDP-GlcNAc:undecaprenyl-phosphate GlcNAc-1-phosphate transferase
MAAIGIAGEIYGVAEWKMFFGFLAVFGIYFFLLTHAWKLTRFIKSLNN